jgi:4-hydroxybenzoate polyprenyltransferase
MAKLIFVMFLTGLLALVFDLLSIFLWLSPWLALVHIVIAYIMFTHIWKKEQEGEKEKLAERIQELETQVRP